ncbi:hypothetical protein [Nonomuraea sp. CA-141351]|uniref:hypothetical protein n=1 Tax=Nonomuraea sp. CA-141351 TaxID=3239996 RepID=UPI003D92B58D
MTEPRPLLTGAAEGGEILTDPGCVVVPTSASRLEPRSSSCGECFRSSATLAQGALGHASIVLTADTYVSVLPQLCHDSARAIARLVLKAVRVTNRKIGKTRKTT